MIRGISESAGEDKLWKDFVKAVQEGNENQVRSILLALESGRLRSFLTRKIRNSLQTVLHLAVMHGKVGIVRLLLEKGSDVHSVDHKKYTVLHTAVRVVQDNNIEVIRLLLNHTDVNLNAVDEYENTAIKLAAEKGNIEAVKLLTDKGADISKGDIVGNTAIHIAAEKGHFRVLLLLLPTISRNPGLIHILGQPNKDRNTPLHLAVKKQCQNSVAILLYYGAYCSMGVENQHNETPKQLAEDKEIIKLLEDPSKPAQLVQELLRDHKPSTRTFGRGSSVEADSPGSYSVTEHKVQDTSSTSAFPLPPGPMQQVVYLNTPQVNINYKTEVHDGGSAAIGPNSQVNQGSAPVPAGDRPQSLPAGESSYNVNVSGGNASIGDHSVTNVGTLTPRTPSSGGGTGNNNTPWFPDHVETRDNRSEGSSCYPAENASPDQLSHPIPEEKSSGTPSENVSKTPGEPRHPVPEVGKESISATPGELSNPVPETSSSGIPTEHSGDSDAPENLPKPVPEESTPKTAEIVTSINSSKDGSLIKEDGCVPSPKSDEEVTTTIDPSRDSETRRTARGPIDSTETNTPVSGRNDSVEPSGAANESTEDPSLSSLGIIARGVGRVPENGKSSNSPGNTRIIQPVGSSRNAGIPMAGAVGISPCKTGENDASWGPALQKKTKGGLSRGVPKEATKRLLEMEPSNSSTTDTTLSGILSDQGPDSGTASNDSMVNRQFPESQKWSGGDTGPKSQGVDCQSNDTGKKGGKGGIGNGGGLPRVGLRRGQGSHVLVSEHSSENQRSPTCHNAGASTDDLENATMPRLSSSSKEAPHRKERFLRDGSVLDGDNPAGDGQLPKVNPNRSTGAALAGQDESVRSEQQSVVCDNGTSGTLPSGLVDPLSVSENGDAPIVTNAYPEDDFAGTKRCDSECTIM